MVDFLDALMDCMLDNSDAIVVGILCIGLGFALGALIW